MKRKVLGIMLIFGLLPAIFACSPKNTSTETSISLDPGQIAFELYDGDDLLVSRKIVDYDESDTLLGLLQENYTVYCQGENGSPDDTCSFEGPYGYYIMGIDSVTAFQGNVFISFCINGEFAVTGIGATDITDGYIYQFFLDSY